MAVHTPTGSSSDAIVVVVDRRTRCVVILVVCVRWSGGRMKIIQLIHWGTGDGRVHGVTGSVGGRI